MQVKKGERYRIPAASDGTMFTVLNGYAAYATLYTAAGETVQPGSLTAPRWITARASNLPN